MPDAPLRLDYPLPEAGTVEDEAVHAAAQAGKLLRINRPGHPLHGVTGRREMAYYSFADSDYSMFWINTGGDATVRVWAVYTEVASE